MVDLEVLDTYVHTDVSSEVGNSYSERCNNANTNESCSL